MRLHIIRQEVEIIAPFEEWYTTVYCITNKRYLLFSAWNVPLIMHSRIMWDMIDLL